MNAWLIVLLALLALPVHADETAHPVTLWQIEGANNSVYLLGSIHLLRSQDYPLPAVLDAAYDEAEVLIMEIDMDDLDPLAMQTAFTSYGVLQDDSTLEDLMGDKLYAEATAAAKAVNIPLEMLNKTEPWYAAITIQIMLLDRIGFDPALGVEMYMMSKAVTDGKRIDGLETIDEQLQFLDGMSLQAQRDMLLATLTEGADLAAEMDKLISAWHHGDAGTLASEMLEELAEHEELYKALVTDRNARWVKQLRKLFEHDDDYLIVVGALHLVGPSGVPLQLEQLGYNVRQLSESPPIR